MKNTHDLPFGSQVRVISHGPFRGLHGTILQIDTIVDDLEDPFCYYLIELEKTTCAEAIWFEYHEVEFIGVPPSLITLPSDRPTERKNHPADFQVSV